jgi:hypothetical protein
MQREVGTTGGAAADPGVELELPPLLPLPFKFPPPALRACNCFGACCGCRAALLPPPHLPP